MHQNKHKLSSTSTIFMKQKTLSYMTHLANIDYREEGERRDTRADIYEDRNIRTNSVVMVMQRP